MALAVEQDVAADPGDIGALGGRAEMPETNGRADAIEETGRLRGRRGLRDPGRAVERRVVEPCVGVLWSQG